MEHIFLGERVPLSSPLVIFMSSRTDVFNSEPECVEQTHEILNNKFEKLSAILSMFLILNKGIGNQYLLILSIRIFFALLIKFPTEFSWSLDFCLEKNRSSGDYYRVFAIR